MGKLVCIAKFNHNEEALVAQQYLKTQGFESFVESEEGGSMAPETAPRNTMLLVEANLAEAANENLQKQAQGLNESKGE